VSKIVTLSVCYQDSTPTVREGATKIQNQAGFIIIFWSCSPITSVAALISPPSNGRIAAAPNPYLRSEWVSWRKTTPLYGFGRTEMTPIESSADGIAWYVYRYISRHIGNRHPADKGARLVRYPNIRTR
jgi:hypothetical protein